jgi:peptidoglycan/LPS O-acetylase OafA/YrhL
MGKHARANTGSPSQRSASLDALRGLAIFLVILSHYLFAGPPLEKIDGLKSALYALASLGWTGVDLFFVLSGFLIGGIIIDNREAENLFRTFYLRRAARILPLYGLAVAVAFCLIAGLWKALPYFATFSQNLWMISGFRGGHLDVTWSLALEEQFYLLAPLTIRFVSYERLPAVLLALILLGPVWRGFCWLALEPEQAWMAAYVLLPCRSDALGMGVLLALGMREPVWRASLSRHRWRLLVPALTCGAVAIGLVFAGHHWRHSLFSVIGYSLVDAAWVGVFVFAITQEGRVWSFCFRLVAPIGVGAYSIYLFHNYGPILAQQLFNWASTGTLGRTTFLAAFNAVIAFTLWKVIEQPIIRLGHRSQYLRPLPVIDRSHISPAGEFTETKVVTCVVR